MLIRSKHAIELRLYEPRPMPTTPSAEIPGMRHVDSITLVVGDNEVDDDFWRKWAEQNKGTPLLAALIHEEKRDGDQQVSGGL